jgi:hypothetical protein
MVPPQMVGEGEADGVDCRGIERRLAGNATNAVGSEQLLHQGSSVTIIKGFADAQRSFGLILSIPPGRCTMGGRLCGLG